MKILLITNENWNDIISGNNFFKNWFEGREDIEIRIISTDEGKPYNKVVTKYFQITDKMMFKSLLGPKAGNYFELSFSEMEKHPQTQSFATTSKFYSFMKSISGTPIRLLREFIWVTGRYNKPLLKKFIDDFNPDIVFSPHLFSWKIRRLERLIKKYTNAPMVAFAGDAEVSLKVKSYSPLFWINRILLNQAFKKHLKNYNHYITLTDLHAEEYKTKYNISVSSLYKGALFPNQYKLKIPNDPIRLVYAGRLYCNRWKTLGEIGKTIKELNSESTKIILEIYSQDKLSKRQMKILNEKNFIFLKGSISTDDLQEIYQKSDIALHVESLDKKNRLKTRLSFSTKIVDLMASSCAILTIAWKNHAGYKYLYENDAAFCASSYSEILPLLEKIIKFPELIQIYADKALKCGQQNHNLYKIQEQLNQILKNTQNY